MEQKALKLIMAGLLILSMALTGREAAEYVGAMHAVNALRETGMGADDSGRLCVVVDAGHGGDDPGKIGINGAPEKDINLQIAQKLKKYLEAEDVEVVLTRETEDGLYDAHASNKKVQDMKRRIEIIEKTDPVLTVSIHQNSYPEEYVHGAQVFYYTGKFNRKKFGYVAYEGDKGWDGKVGLVDQVGTDQLLSDPNVPLFILFVGRCLFLSRILGVTVSP